MPRPPSSSSRTGHRFLPAAATKKAANKATKKKKYHKFTEPAGSTLLDCTEADYWYEETEDSISFVDPYDHVDYEAGGAGGEGSDSDAGPGFSDDEGDTVEELLLAATVVAPAAANCQWERLVDASSNEYFYDHSTGQSAWDVPPSLLLAEAASLKRSRVLANRERVKRARKGEERRGRREEEREREREEKRGAVKGGTFEGFYAKREVRRRVELLVIENKVRVFLLVRPFPFSFLVLSSPSSGSSK